MAYIRKNVNIILLLLIIALLASMAGLTTVFQYKNQNLTLEYQQKVEEINRLSTNLSTQRLRLNQTFSELQVRVADTTKYNELYSNLSDEKKRTDAELKSTSNELSDKIRQLADAQQSLATERSKSAALQRSNTELETQVDQLATLVSDLRSQVCTLKRQLNQPC